MIVFVVAGLGTATAADADAEVQRVAELDALLRTVVRNGNVGAVVLLRFVFETLENNREIELAEFAIVLLEKLVDRGFFACPVGEGGEGFRESGGT